MNLAFYNADGSSGIAKVNDVSVLYKGEKTHLKELDGEICPEFVFINEAIMTL